jgi:hypothetical protein
MPPILNMQRLLKNPERLIVCGPKKSRPRPSMSGGEKSGKMILKPDARQGSGACGCAGVRIFSHRFSFVQALRLTLY